MKRNPNRARNNRSISGGRRQSKTIPVNLRCSSLGPNCIPLEFKHARTGRTFANVDLEPSLFQAVKGAAAREGLNLGQFFMDAVAWYLSRAKANAQGQGRAAA